MVRIKLTIIVVVLVFGLNNIFAQTLENARNFALSERYDDAKDALNQLIKTNQIIVQYILCLGRPLFGNTLLIQFPIH